MAGKAGQAVAISTGADGGDGHATAHTLVATGTCQWDAAGNAAGGGSGWGSVSQPREAEVTAACGGGPRLSSLRYLLFDGHGGPLQSMFSFLVNSLGVPSRNIGVACYPFACNRLHLNIPVPIHRHVEMEQWSPMHHDIDHMDALYVGEIGNVILI